MPYDEIVSSENQTYFIPRQLRDPLQKGTRFLFMAGSIGPSQRSGLKENGLGKTRGSVCIR